MKTWIKLGWVASFASALALFGVLLSLTPVTQGLAIDIDEKGQFFLSKGAAEMEISQWFGWILFVITYLFGFLIIAAVVLGIPVFLEHGTLKVTEILDETKPADRALLATFRAAAFVVFVGFAIGAFTLFLRFAGW